MFRSVSGPAALTDLRGMDVVALSDLEISYDGQCGAVITMPLGVALQLEKLNLEADLFLTMGARRLAVRVAGSCIDALQQFELLTGAGWLAVEPARWFEHRALEACSLEDERPVSGKRARPQIRRVSQAGNQGR